MQQEDAQAISVLVAYLIYLPYVILYLTARWRIFRKMGRKGWEAIVPYYNVYVLFKVLYGNGWQMLLLLIPFYNIYVAFKLNFDLAYAFGKGGGFGLGLTFLSMIFSCILAFGKASFHRRFPILSTLCRRSSFARDAGVFLTALPGRPSGRS